MKSDTKIKNMKKLLFIFFILLMTVPLSPQTSINAYNVLGEVKASIVVQEAEEEIADIASQITVSKRVKGVNRFNLWFILDMIVACIQFLACVYRLPREDTIVDDKIRMDN